MSLTFANNTWMFTLREACYKWNKLKPRVVWWSTWSPIVNKHWNRQVFHPCFLIFKNYTLFIPLHGFLRSPAPQNLGFLGAQVGRGKRCSFCIWTNSFRSGSGWGIFGDNFWHLGLLHCLTRHPCWGRRRSGAVLRTMFVHHKTSLFL